MNRRQPERPTAAQLADALRAGSRQTLAQAITLVESRRPADASLAADLLDLLLPHTGRSFRLGVSGAPGVGKSSLLEALGLHLLAQGARPAVLAIDPSSARGGGSILADKTRMAALAAAPEAFVRPSPAGRHLGGTQQATPEAILLCEAAGYDWIIVETVGVGQSETEVRNMVDCFLLLVQPGAGDELQAIKRGIVEVADVLAVTKADGPLEALAQHALQDYVHAAALYPPARPPWQLQGVATSAAAGTGLAELHALLGEFAHQMQATGAWQAERARQRAHWLGRHLAWVLEQWLEGQPALAHFVQSHRAAVAQGQASPLRAAEHLRALLAKAELPGLSHFQ